MTEGTRPEGGWEPPSGSTGGGEWLPPVPAGPTPGTPPPGAPPGWRISPKAIDLDPDAPPGPEPWADPGNSVAGVALGLSVAGFGLLCVGLGVFALPIAIAGTVLSAIGRARIKRGETRHGRVEVAVGLAVGIGTLVLAAIAVIAYLATR
jgi:hypothetical protein